MVWATEHSFTDEVSCRVKAPQRQPGRSSTCDAESGTAGVSFLCLWHLLVDQHLLTPLPVTFQRYGTHPATSPSLPH